MKYLIYLWLLSFANTVAAQRSLPFRIGTYQKNQYRDCIERGNPRCRLDSFEYSGFILEFNFHSGWALGPYRASGQRGGAIGSGIAAEYQPFNRLPIGIHANMGSLYSDIRNQEAILPVLPATGIGSVIPFPVVVNIKNELFYGNLGLRLWAPTICWQPYAMAGLGFLNHSTLLRLYDDDRVPFLGVSDNGLILESRIRHKGYGSRFLAAGIAWNAEYSLNLDLRFTLITAPKFSYQSLKLPEDWNLSYAETDGNGKPSGFDSTQENLHNPTQLVPFRFLLVSFSTTLFFE